jgi:hypothetical protein
MQEWERLHNAGFSPLHNSGFLCGHLAKQTEIPKDDHARRGLIYMQLFQLD